MFGSSVAFVYAVLMQFNIVYTLFFATSIVCASRGIGWWIAHLRNKRKEAAGRAAGSVAVAPGEGLATGQPVTP
jgi:hypothetical protein